MINPEDPTELHEYHRKHNNLNGDITFPGTKQHVFLDWKHYRNAQKNSCKRSTSNCIILKFQNAKNIKKNPYIFQRRENKSWRIKNINA